MVEVKNEKRMHKVNESVTNISLVYEVNGQVQEIVLSLIVKIDLFKERNLIILIRNVLDH